MKKQGRLFFIVGNSGSGKDSILSWVVQHWQKTTKLVVPLRYITRPESPNTEKYHSVSVEEFFKLRKRFALKWVSYDLHYGVAKEDVDGQIKQGNLVVVNVSRQIIDKSRKKYPGMQVIFVKVPIDIILDRLQTRGREDETEMEKRIERAKETGDELPGADFVVENTGTIEEAGQKLLEYLEGFASE
jgi:ribose 1,5-bisphosphokinase